MEQAVPLPAAGLTIAAVEQATGIARATLRIWERRYGFPNPGRDERDERSYAPDEVDKLRLIAGLMERGHRPGRLVKLPIAQLEAMQRAGASSGPAVASDDPVLHAIRRHDTLGLFLHLQGEVLRQGLAGFVTGRMAQLNEVVGAAWSCGELQVYEEHLYTETVQQVLRQALSELPPRAAAAHPRVLLATFPDEGHGLGLLMAQAMLALHGAHCTSLGLRVPVQQLVAATAAFGADIVGVSCTASVNPAHVLRGLEQLRNELPPDVLVWAGGSSPVLARRRIPGVVAFREIAQVPEALANWRAQRA